MEELLKELNEIANKYRDFCKDYKNCENCPFSKVLFTHCYGGEERICDILDML